MTVWTGLSIAGAGLTAVGAIGGKMHEDRIRAEQFSDRLDKMENDFHSRFDDIFNNKEDESQI